MHRYFVLLATAVVVILSPAAATAQEAVDSVSLRFGWPVGMTGRVEQEFTRLQQTPERSDTTHVRSAYRLQVREHAEGRLIAIDSFRVLPVGSVAGPRDADAARLLSWLGSLVPSFVVSPDGEFLRIADVERVRAALDSLFQPLLREMEEAPPQLKEFMATAMSREALTASAAQEWNAIVGTWVGADWEVGALYELVAEEPIALFPGQSVPMRYEFAAVERTSCTDEHADTSCVLLSMHSAPDSAGLANFVRGFVANLLPEQRELAEAMQNMRTSNELTVVADPHTLRPYWVELIKRVEMTIGPIAGEAGGHTSRIDRRSATYTYDE